MAKKKPIKRFTHADRAKRRKQMARKVHRGRPTAEVAGEFGVSVRTVSDAAREFPK